MRTITWTFLMVLEFGVWLGTPAVVKVHDRSRRQAGDGGGDGVVDVINGDGGGDVESVFVSPVTNPISPPTPPATPITIQDSPTSDPPFNATATQDTTTSISTPIGTTTTITSTPNTIIEDTTTTTTTTTTRSQPSTTTFEPSNPNTAASLLSTTSAPFTSNGIISNTVVVNTTVKPMVNVGNFIYSMWGFLLGGLLTYFSLSDSFRLAVIQTADGWFGPPTNRRRRRRQTLEEGLKVYVHTTFTTFTNALDRIHEISESIKKF